MPLGEYLKKNLQKASFPNEDLSYVRFADSDLRGADFTGANLSGADFTHVRTGITTANTVILFFGALVVSLFSGYIAMLAGQTTQQMLASKDHNIRNAGYATLVITVVFILYYYLKGGRHAIRHLVLPVIAVALVTGFVFYVSGVGTGAGMMYLALAFVLVVVMFVVGTIARAAAGSLSNILFLVVALSGGMFGKSLGGGIGTVIMAMSCAMISKKALSGAKGFEVLRKIACVITKKFGTSFRNARLTNTNFSWARIRNCDFTGADLTLSNWNHVSKTNCIDQDKIITEKKIHEKRTPSVTKN
jgi:hypothetical protein